MFNLPSSDERKWNSLDLGGFNNATTSFQLLVNTIDDSFFNCAVKNFYQNRTNKVKNILKIKSGRPKHANSPDTKTWHLFEVSPDPYSCSSLGNSTLLVQPTNAMNDTTPKCNLHISAFNKWVFWNCTWKSRYWRNNKERRTYFDSTVLQKDTSVEAFSHIAKY